jgi:hypothetical protein
MAISVASGKPWLGHFPAAPGRVLYFDGESSEVHNQARIQALAMGGLIGEDDLPLTFVIGEGLRIDDKADWQKYEELISAYQPDVVMIDSLTRIHGASENDAGQMSDVFLNINRLQIRHGAAFVIVDHARKKSMIGNDPEEMQRGSSEKRAWPDSILFASSTEENHITIAHTKARNTAKHGEFMVRMSVDDGVANLNYVGDVSSSAGGVKLNEVIAAIHALTVQLGPDGPDIQTIAAQAECSEKTAKKYLNMLMKAGQVETRSVKSSGGGRPRNVYSVKPQS